MPMKPILETEDRTIVLWSYDMVVLGIMGNTRNEKRQQKMSPILRVLTNWSEKSRRIPNPMLMRSEKPTEMPSLFSSILIGKMYSKHSGGYSIGLISTCSSSDSFYD